MPLRAIYYDTETTGIRHDKDRIIEIAAYDPVRDASFTQLINPECQIPQESIAICGITDAMVAGCPTFPTVATQWIEFCGPDAVLIAHNNDKFDKLFIESEMARAGISLPSWKYVDTLKWSRKYRSDLPGHSLQALREVYGFPANQAHRALDDVMTLYRIASLMFDDLPIEKVIELLSTQTQPNRMPFGKYQGRILSEIPRDYFAWLKKSGAFDRADNRELKEELIRQKLLPE